MRLVGARGGLEQSRIKRDPAQNAQFPVIGQPLERRFLEPCDPFALPKRQLGQLRARIAEDRFAARVAVLDVKNRVLSTCLLYTSDAADE